MGGAVEAIQSRSFIQFETSPRYPYVAARHRHGANSFICMRPYLYFNIFFNVCSLGNKCQVDAPGRCLKASSHLCAVLLSGQMNALLHQCAELSRYFREYVIGFTAFSTVVWVVQIQSPGVLTHNYCKLKIAKLSHPQNPVVLTNFVLDTGYESVYLSFNCLSWQSYLLLPWVRSFENLSSPVHKMLASQ